jgi:hypothetical protein
MPNPFANEGVFYSPKVHKDSFGESLDWLLVLTWTA